MLDCLVSNGTAYVACNSPNKTYLFATDIIYSLLKEQSRNLVKCLTGTELVLAKPANMSSVTFYQIISTKILVAILLIKSKYWISWRERVEQPEML